MLLPAHRDCVQCSLHERVKSIGISSRLADVCTGDKTKAVLLLGKAPGLDEDSQNRAFVGPSGLFVNDLYVGAMNLQEVADVYLGNVVRCRLPEPKMALPPKSKAACRQWLFEDLRLLRQNYEQVVILVTGSEALATLVPGISLPRFPQGMEITIEGSVFPVFATYLAAILLPRNDPSKVSAIRDHLLMLREFLECGDLAKEFNEITVDRTSRVPPEVDILSLDIETYGCIETLPLQRFFHPRKSLMHDKIQRGQLVVTAAAAWRDPTTKALCNRFWDFSNGQDLLEFMVDMVSIEKPVLLGQNIAFDVMYLREWNRRFYEWLNPFGKVALVDLAVLNFLDSDVRPERSLKTLSPLLRITSYEGELSLKKGERYSDVGDPRLASYNVKDAVATLRGYEVFQKRLPLCYGKDTPKGSIECLAWYSDLLWLVIGMSERGIPHDLSHIRKSHQRISRWVSRMEEWATRRGWVMKGEGSRKFKEELAERCVDELNLRSDRRVNRTTITKKISFDSQNIKLFKGKAQKNTELHSILRLIHKYTMLRDVLSRYTTPMLGLDTKKRLGSSLLSDDNVIGYAYPTWYVVPMAHDISNESGGTRQGRITAKEPAVQTSPAIIEEAEITTEPGRFRVSIDMAQIEYRVPAMYSGDEAMLEDFRNGVNIHEATASIFAGRPVDKYADPVLYHAGKTANFLVGFYGKADKLQETLMEETGMYVPLAKCEDFIESYYKRHPAYKAWQDLLIATAKQTGRLEIPVIGIHRSFLGTPAVIDKTYIPAICNFPVQTTAALFTLSAQIATEKLIRLNQMDAYLYKNTYDEGVYDVGVTALPWFLETVPEQYRHPPLLGRFATEISSFDTRVPLECSVTIRYNGGPDRTSDDYLPLRKALMDIAPLGSNIVCEVIKNEQMTTGGLVLPDQSIGESIWSRVLAVGPDVDPKTGVIVGAEVLLAQWSGQIFQIKENDETIKLVLASLKDVYATKNSHRILSRRDIHRVFHN